MATTLENYRNKIRRLEFATAARDVGFDADFADAALREYGDAMHVNDEGEIEVAGYSSVKEFIGERIRQDRPRYFSPPKKVEALGYTAAELAAMGPSEKMRAATMANKPKGY